MPLDDASRSTPRWLLRSVAILAAIVLFIRLWVIIPQFSPTTDEPAHIGAAVAMVEAGKAIATVSHPPLPRWVMAAPLWLDGCRLPQARGVSVVGKEDLGYAWGTQVLYHSPKPAHVLLTHVRRVMLIFPLLALLYLYRLTSTLAGEPAACAAAVFFSVDPTLLGHGFWACSDVAGCAGTLAALFYGYRWIDRPTPGRAAAAGAAIGLGIALKFSGLFVIPAVSIVALIEGRKAGVRLKPWVMQTAVVVVTAFIALWATYAFNIDTLGNQTVLSAVPQWERLPHWFLHTPVPMPSLFLGVLRLLAQNHVGLRSYLNGNISYTGWWYYFPEVLLIKSPLGFVAALLIAIGLTACSVIRLVLIAAGGSRGLRPKTAASARGDGGPPQRSPFDVRRTTAMLLTPLVVFACFTLTAKYDLGIRYILPSVALLYALVAWQLARGWRTVLLMVLMLVAAIETAAVHPDYLAFYNVAVGGASGGARYALDSNLDWNQDDYRLAAYIRAHPELAPYSLRLTGERNGPMLQAETLNPGALARPVHGSVLFISKNARLVGQILPWLKRHRPIATVGVSIDVYDLRAAPAVDEPEDTPPADDPKRVG